jgi:hypothetical protein
MGRRVGAGAATPWHKMASALAQVRIFKVRRKEWVEALFDDIHALRVLSEMSFHVSLRIRILLDLISVSKKDGDNIP